MSDNLETPQSTTAVTGTPDMPSMLPDIPPSGGILATVASLIAGVFFLRRRISRDGLEVTKDGAEGGMLNTAIAERDKAMAQAAEAWKTRAEDAKQIGKLTSDVEHLSSANEKLIQEVTSLRSDIKDMKDILHLFLPVSVLRMLEQDDGVDIPKLREAILKQTGQREAILPSVAMPATEGEKP